MAGSIDPLDDLFPDESASEGFFGLSIQTSFFSNNALEIFFNCKISSLILDLSISERIDDLFFSCSVNFNSNSAIEFLKTSRFSLAIEELLKINSTSLFD